MPGRERRNARRQTRCCWDLVLDVVEDPVPWRKEESHVADIIDREVVVKPRHVEPVCARRRVRHVKLSITPVDRFVLELIVMPFEPRQIAILVLRVPADKLAGGRVPIVVVCCVNGPANPYLLLIVPTHGLLCGHLGAVQGRQQHRQKDGDDHDHHEQFDQREAAVQSA